MHFVGLQGWPNHVQSDPSPALPLAPCPNSAHFKAALFQPADIAGDAQLPCAAGVPTLALSIALFLSLVLAEHHWAGARGTFGSQESASRALVISHISPSAVAVQMELQGPQHGGSCH